MSSQTVPTSNTANKGTFPGQATRARAPSKHWLLVRCDYGTNFGHLVLVSPRIFPEHTRVLPSPETGLAAARNTHKGCGTVLGEEKNRARRRAVLRTCVSPITPETASNMTRVAVSRLYFSTTATRGTTATNCAVLQISTSLDRRTKRIEWCHADI